jgi:hypothetical protein
MDGAVTGLSVAGVQAAGGSGGRYEVENIERLVTSSPPLSPLCRGLGPENLARLIGVTELTIGSLIAAKPFAPRASAPHS